MSNEETPMWKKIDELVKSHKIMLFVKGSKETPMCGFSAAAMQCFNELGAEYQTENILDDPELKPMLAQYSNWPTTPQIFIHGKFVGGCDITRELHSTGELKKLIET